MAEMKRVTVDIDGTEVSAIEAHYVVTRAANQLGQRIGDSMRARAYFYADIKDTSRNGQDKIINLWKLATETEDQPHKVTITYYKDDKGSVLNTVKFTGWISVFETFNPALDNSSINSNGIGGGAGAPSAATLMQHGNVLYCEMSVMLDDSNFSKHSFTK